MLEARSSTHEVREPRVYNLRLLLKGATKSMKTPVKFGKWMVLGAMVLATTASAQKEQWLQYHVSREGRGYRGLNLTTNIPVNVALPKFSAKPYFAHWTTPLDAKGRWVCFDRTRKAGPYDLLYVDGAGDGRLDNKTPIKARRVDQYYAYFEPAKVVFKGEEGPITYHLVFRFMSYDVGNRIQRQLGVESGGYYAGLVDLGGKKRRIEVVDSNVNGTFNDSESDAEGCDHVAVEGEKGGERFLGKLLEVGDQLYRVEVARDGAFVKLQKAENIAFGQVRVPETISEFAAFGANGHFMRAPGKGEFKLPAGKYRVHEWKIKRKDGKGASWQLAGRDFPDSTIFEVAADKPKVLDIGEPIRAVMKYDDLPGQIAFDLSFKGRSNESISILKGEQNPPGPRLALATPDGSFRVTNTFEFG